MSEEALTEHQQDTFRKALKATFGHLLNIPYDTEPGDPVIWSGRGKWLDLSKPPKALDCSGGTAGTYHFNGFKMPDGAQAQYNFTRPVTDPRVGDLVFAAHGKDITRIHHVGMVYDDFQIIEARALDKKRPFKTGCVILRPRSAWEKWDEFCGYRVHPKLIEA